MIVEDQQPVIDLLADVRSYPGLPAGTAVERIETHSAIVFLAGERAYKLKRAVRYDYLDFSTCQRRQRFCEAEVALNRRTAPSLYLGVAPIIRRKDGRLTIGDRPAPEGSDSEVVDWLVVMRRFADDQLFDRLAAQQRLDVALMPPLGVAVARFHAEAERCRDRTGVAAMRWVVDGNALGFASDGHERLDPVLAADVTDAARQAIARHAALLERRAAAGWIRRCHGDLHLRNIVRLGDQPVPFDAIEFNDDLACIDVLYDLAFLLMDLWRLDLRQHANALLNAYLAAAPEPAHDEALALLPLFLSCRSAVRAKTSATASRLQSDAGRARQLADLARDYLADARRLLQPPPPSLIAIGGFSGTGKSTVARLLAPGCGAAPGALVLRSDVVRKQLMGVGETERLPAAAYTPAMHGRVYEALAATAAVVARAGHAVIVDAVFAREEERHAIEAAANAAGVRFHGAWLEAPPPVLRARVSQRTGDASDATAAIVEQQIARGAGDLAWPRISADAPAEEVVRRVRGVLV